MNRIAIPLMLLLAGALAGCGPKPAKTCADVTCTAAQICDTTTIMCRAKTCVDDATICTAGQTCDTPTATCKAPVGKCAAVTCAMYSSCDPADGMCKLIDPPGTVALLGLTQIDRMGRPGVNTALTNPFDLYTPTGATMAEAGDTTKNNYNADKNPLTWQASWTPAIQKHMAIFDGLDSNCTNGIGRTAGAATLTSYSNISGILAGDLLNVDTSIGTCAQYLGAELKALGAAVNDCGGRKLEYDVIDVTYSAIVAGATTGITDGIANDSTFSATFPFLAAPNN